METLSNNVNGAGRTGLLGRKLRLRPDSWGRLGEATALVEGHRVFVFGAIPGEEVLAEVFRERRRYVAARVLEVIEPSPHRVDPPCPYFGPCTGCQWQHVDYDAQLQYKSDAVIDALQRVGGFPNPPVRPIVPSPDQFGYRNHARFTIGESGSLGFVNRETRQHVTVDECMLMDPGVNDVLKQLQGHCDETTQLSVRWGVNTGDYLVQPTLKEADVPVATGQKHYVETVHGHSFRISSPSFFQVNIRQLEQLVGLVKEGLKLSGNETLVDAYAGVGTFALLLAPYANRIIAIEDSPAAVEDAKANAEGVLNVEFLQGRTEQALSELQASPDGVILDPSRKGCHSSALKALAELKPRRVVYVSCDPGTLARDLKILCKNAFLLESVTPVDMFPQTHHVECIAVLTLRRPLDGLTLASSSPRRRELMTTLDAPFEAVTPNVDESVEDAESPEEIVRRLALTKARAVADRRPDSPVVGADTLVVLDGRALGKPAGAAQARQMLMSLRGRVHRVLTGVAVVDDATGNARTALCESRVLMRNYSASEIDQYIASGSPFDRAGGYGVQDQTLNPVAHVEGCRANVIGLPLCTMARLLKESGFNVESLSLPVECGWHLQANRDIGRTPYLGLSVALETDSSRSLSAAVTPAPMKREKKRKKE